MPPLEPELPELEEELLEPPPTAQSTPHPLPELLELLELPELPPASVQELGSVEEVHVRPAQLVPLPKYFPEQPEELLRGSQRTLPSMSSK